MKQHNDHDRIALIGAGHVGSTAAYALMLRALVREIVLIGSNAALAEAEIAKPCTSGQKIQMALAGLNSK